jgi:hypothetical protein
VASTATVQTALVGTPVIVLNVFGFDWAWPLGGDSEVPVARSADELAGWLKRWAAGETLPGREDLLGALGAGRPDPTGALLRLVAAPAAPAETLTRRARRARAGMAAASKLERR